MTISRDELTPLDALAAEAKSCTQCRLSQGRTHVVFGAGNPHATLMLIGEAPGRDEDLQGWPFVGRGGTVLERLLQDIGMTRQDVYLTNVIKCRPPNNRQPEVNELDACEPYLARQVALIQPELIVTLGTYATQTLLKTQLPISQLRGRFHTYHDVSVLPTFHPAFLLRNPERLPVTVEDFQMVQRALGHQASPSPLVAARATPPPTEAFTRQLIEAASTQGLGWVLDQQCELRWADDLLEVSYIGPQWINRDLLFEDNTTKTLQDLVLHLTGRAYAIRIIDGQERQDVPPPVQPVVTAPPPVPEAAAPPFGISDKRFWIARGREDRAQETPSPVSPSRMPTYIERLEEQLQEKDRLLSAQLQATADPEGISNQGQVIDASAPLVAWQDLKFRSKSEVRIAEALDQRGVLFLPNCKARLGGSARMTREADFLICHQGRWGMLEVDGEPWHPPSRTVEDHRRDRLFKEHGIQLVEHFDAAECYQHPELVVRRFLDLLEQLG